jgi:apolipoprotein N-acyltransferase
MESDKKHNRIYKLLAIGFIAGFIATLTFHQIALWLLRMATIAPFAPYNMAATQPWGIPAVISLALWGGVWGALFAYIQQGFPRGGGYWATAFGFGAIFPSLVALLIVAPLKGHPLGGGWHWQLLLTAFLINGVWGIGTGVFFKLMSNMPERRVGNQPECSPGMAC